MDGTLAGQLFDELHFLGAKPSPEIHSALLQILVCPSILAPFLRTVFSHHASSITHGDSPKCIFLTPLCIFEVAQKNVLQLSGTWL